MLKFNLPAVSPALRCKLHNVHSVIVSEVLYNVHVQIFCMKIKDPKDTAVIDLNIEPAYVGTPFSTLLTNPAYPQLPGETSCLLSLSQTESSCYDSGHSCHASHFPPLLG